MRLPAIRTVFSATASQTQHTIRKDGKVKTARGTAKVADKATNAKLKVTFFWPFYGNYWIIGLSPDYRYAIVGEPNRKYLWILSRTPDMDATTYKELLRANSGCRLRP